MNTIDAKHVSRVWGQPITNALNDLHHPRARGTVKRRDFIDNFYEAEALCFQLGRASSLSWPFLSAWDIKLAFPSVGCLFCTPGFVSLVYRATPSGQ